MQAKVAILYSSDPVSGCEVSLRILNEDSGVTDESMRGAAWVYSASKMSNNRHLSIAGSANCLGN